MATESDRRTTRLRAAKEEAFGRTLSASARTSALNRNDPEKVLANSSLLGKSNEHKFQPIKPTSLLVDQPSVNNITNSANMLLQKTLFAPQPPTVMPTPIRVPAFSVTPVLNTTLGPQQFAPFFQNEINELKQQIERKIDKEVIIPKMSLLEINRMSIVDDAMKALGRNKALADDERTEIETMLSTNIRKLNQQQRNRAIAKYHNKKDKRKNSAYIRYKIRQDLAGQRVRNKGKFVRNQRVDLKKLAEEFMKGLIKRATNESGL